MTILSMKGAALVEVGAGTQTLRLLGLAASLQPGGRIAP